LHTITELEANQTVELVSFRNRCFCENKKSLHGQKAMDLPDFTIRHCMKLMIALSDKQLKDKGFFPMHKNIYKNILLAKYTINGYHSKYFIIYDDLQIEL